MTKKNQLIKKIEKILGTIKVFINHDGGDLEFINLDDHGVLTLKIFGACINCPHADVTFDNGVKVVLMQEIPELKDVIFTSNDSII